MTFIAIQHDIIDMYDIQNATTVSLTLPQMLKINSNKRVKTVNQHSITKMVSVTQYVHLITLKM